jgi:hypothetical protein
MIWGDSNISVYFQDIDNGQFQVAFISMNIGFIIIHFQFNSCFFDQSVAEVCSGHVLSAGLVVHFPCRSGNFCFQRLRFYTVFQPGFAGG